MVFSAVSAVITVFIIAAVGFFISYKGWAPASVTDFITKFIINITLPATAVASFLNYFTQESIKEAWIYILAAGVASLLIYAICKLFIKIFNITKHRRGVFTALFCYSNSVFIGLPIATAIFGEAGIPFALFYYIVNTVFMNSLGYMDIEKDGAALCAPGDEKPKKRSLLRRFLPPPFIGVIIGIVLVLLGVKLPEFLMSAITYTGNITAPLAIIYVGIVLQRAGFSSWKKLDREMILVFIGRFVIAPLCMLLVGRLFGLAAFPLQVLIMQISLPSVTQSAIYAGMLRADTEYAASGVAQTTLLSFATIPIIYALVGML